MHDESRVEARGGGAAEEVFIQVAGGTARCSTTTSLSSSLPSSERARGRANLTRAALAMPGGAHGHAKQWEPEEDLLIIEYHAKLGPKWKDIAERLPGRSVRVPECGAPLAVLCRRRVRHTPPGGDHTHALPSHATQVASVRNRHQRIEKGRKLREDGFETKNRCHRCGEPRRGHTCKAKLAEVAIPRDDQAETSNPPLLTNQGPAAASAAAAGGLPIPPPTFVNAAPAPPSLQLPDAGEPLSLRRTRSASKLPIPSRVVDIEPVCCWQPIPAPVGRLFFGGVVSFGSPRGRCRRRRRPCSRTRGRVTSRRRTRFQRTARGSTHP